MSDAPNLDPAPHPVEPRSHLTRPRLWPLALGALFALVFGVATAHTDYSFGPHEATYAMTLDHNLTVDLGPLGSIVIDTGAVPQLKGKTGPLGMRITVHEIPTALDLGDVSQTRDELAGKLALYAQLFADPGSTIAIVAGRLVTSALTTAGVAWLTFTAVYLAGYLVLGPSRRRLLADDFKQHWRWAAAGGVLVIVAMVLLVALRPQSGAADDEPLAALRGTPLAGARVTGLLGGVLQTYGGAAVKAVEDNEKFYTEASAAMAKELQTTSAPEGTIPVLMISDLHCNLGMFPVLGTTATSLGTKLILNAGDTTVSGTSVESYCVDALARAIPQGATMVVSGGNHDSDQTDSQERKAGMTVLDGSVKDVQGFHILGDSDPRLSALGSGTTLKGKETIEDLGARMATVAQEHQPVDVLLIHDPKASQPVLEQGLAPLALAGHLHRRVGPEQYGEGVLYVSSSTGRGVDQATMIGPLKGDAELTVFYFDAETRRATHYRILTVTPQAKVDIGPAYPMPEVSPTEGVAGEGSMPTSTPLATIPEGDPNN